MKLKLDLHTHCHEATSHLPPTPEIVASLVARIKAQGLDGIAITEHWDYDYGFKVKEMVEKLFPNQVLIIPGREIDGGMGEEVVELYLPNNSLFRFWAHPTYYGDEVHKIGEIQGVEIENALHNGHIRTERIIELALRHNLLPLRNSDAHYFDRIGLFYNEVELEELYARALPLG